MQSLLRAGARRLAKGPSLPCASAIGGPMPLSRLPPSMCVPEAPHAGLLVRLFGGRFISSTASLSSDPNTNPASNPPGPGGAPAPGGGAQSSGGGAPAPGGGAQSSGGGAPAPGAAINTATGGDGPGPVPPFRLLSFGGPANTNLRDSDDFVQENEVLQPVPTDRLITPPPNAGQQYLFPDLGRELYRSALLIPFVAHLRGYSSGGVFEKEGNVGVIEELRAFGLKEMFPYPVDKLTDEMIRKNYQEARDYAVKTIEKKYGKGVLQQFPALVTLSDLIDVLPVNEKKVICNVVLLSRESTTTLIQRMYDFLLKVVPNQKLFLYAKVCAIYDGMPYTITSQSSQQKAQQQKDLWVNKARADAFFNNWIDKKDNRINNLFSRGPGLLKLHRHGCCAHYLGPNVHSLVKALADPVKVQSFAANPLTKADVHHHYEYNFSEFPSVTYDMFEQVGLDEELNIYDLFHIPTWYS